MKKKAKEAIKKNVREYIEEYGMDSWKALQYPEVRATENIPEDDIVDGDTEYHIQQNIDDAIGEVVDEVRILKEYYRKINACEPETMKEDNLIEELIRDFPHEIVGLAMEAWCPDSWDGRVYLTPEGTFNSSTFQRNEHRYEDDPDILVYTLEGNWVGNGSFDPHDIVDEYEWEKLQKIDDDPDFLNSELLRKINISLNERLEEYLIWVIENY